MALPRSPVTLSQLRTFEAVVRRHSVTRAAEELHVTQPAVSLQLKQLAAAVGAPIIEIVGRAVHPTETGRMLLERTVRIFGEWAEFESEVAGLRGLTRGRLRLAAVTTAEYFVPRLLGPFATRYPGIEVALAVDNRSKIVERLVANADDLYIMGMPPETLDLELAPFLANPLVVAAAVDHPLARRDHIPLAALAGERLLMREGGSGTRMAAERYLRERGLVPDIKMELGSNEAIKRAVAAGLGIAVLSAHVLGEQPGREGIAVLDVRGFPIRRSWYLVHPRGRVLSVVARAFLDYAIEQGAQAPRRRAAKRAVRRRDAPRKP